MKTKKIILPESQMPTQWYNIVSDMKNRPLPPLNPATKEPVTLEQMSALFAEDENPGRRKEYHRCIDSRRGGGVHAARIQVGGL